MSTYIEDTALRTLQKYKTADPFEILEQLHAVIRYKDIGTLRGFYHYVRKNVYVYISSSLNHHQKRSVAAHELAHYILHRNENRVFLNSSLYSTSRYEREADEFAAYLLWHGGEHNIQEFPDCSITEVACYTKIPVHYLKLIL